MNPCLFALILGSKATLIDPEYIYLPCYSLLSVHRCTRRICLASLEPYRVEDPLIRLGEFLASSCLVSLLPLTGLGGSGDLARALLSWHHLNISHRAL